MIVTCVTVAVKEGHVDDFIAATKLNHNGSVAEPGNLRFDVLRNADDPSQFLLYEAYEAYESVETAKAHKETAHYRVWRDTVADWMAQPRVGVPYEIICPQERNMW